MKCNLICHICSTSYTKIAHVHTHNIPISVMRYFSWKLWKATIQIIYAYINKKRATYVLCDGNVYYRPSLKKPGITQADISTDLYIQRIETLQTQPFYMIFFEDVFVFPWSFYSVSLSISVFCQYVPLSINIYTNMCISYWHRFDQKICLFIFVN